MKIKDHFLSQEEYEIKHSRYEGILETRSQPSEDKLAAYYDSAEYRSHQTSAKSFKDKIYQSVKAIMINRKKRLIMGYKREGALLDIGAGTGEFLEAFEPQHWSKFAIEPSAKLQAKFQKQNVNLIKKLDQVQDKSFDVITLWHSLEHIPNLTETLQALKRIIKPDGIIIIAVPNHKSYDAQFYKHYWAAWDVPRHLWHFSRPGLKKICKQYHLKCVKEIGMPFDAYYVSLISEDYMPKGSKLRAFCIGALSNLKSNANREFSSIMYILKPSKTNQ